MTNKIPVTLLTGFLGSGKSTLLSDVLQDPDFSNTAVIVNEFGEVGLDNILVTHSQEQVLEMTTGCLCCTIRGDISNTLLELAEKRAAGDLPLFDRVVVETTGLADPAPVIHTITEDPRISDQFELGGIVTTIDAVNGMATLDRQDECVKQAAVADRIILTKADLSAEKAPLDRLVKRLGKLNPGAELQDRHCENFTLEKMFSTPLFDKKSKSPDVQKWLNIEKIAAAHERNHDHDHDHDHRHAHDHLHDVNKHGDNIQTFSLIMEEPVLMQTFVPAMQFLISNHGEDLLRIKGIVCLNESPGHPYILHGVQHVFHEPIELDEWPTEDHRTRLVFITRNISKWSIEAYFASWLKIDERHSLKSS